ncbi:unnamed protein product [Gongylonema pulchrum]|uniref:Uncharacterized protein n=1 Tax=Gongylonema pulchrum TaxID=637853 RepID=A0A183DH51_9BILA|nr:unnamed protein product [Gongylonema pulchrum]
MPNFAQKEKSPADTSSQNFSDSLNAAAEESENASTASSPLAAAQLTSTTTDRGFSNTKNSPANKIQKTPEALTFEADKSEFENAAALMNEQRHTATYDIRVREKTGRKTGEVLAGLGSNKEKSALASNSASSSIYSNDSVANHGSQSQVLKSETSFDAINAKAGRNLSTLVLGKTESAKVENTKLIGAFENSNFETRELNDVHARTNLSILKQNVQNEQGGAMHHQSMANSGKSSTPKSLDSSALHKFGSSMFMPTTGNPQCPPCPVCQDSPNIRRQRKTSENTADLNVKLGSCNAKHEHRVS